MRGRSREKEIKMERRARRKRETGEREKEGGRAGTIEDEAGDGEILAGRER